MDEKKSYRAKGRLDALLDEVGIKIVPIWRNRKNAQSHARGAMKFIVKHHGEYNLKLTLMAIRGGEANKNELCSNTIRAVSYCLAAKNDWLERPSEFMDALEQINLKEIRIFAINLRPWTVTETMRAILYMKLEGIMENGK